MGFDEGGLEQGGLRHNWLISTDESGIGGLAFYGFGSLWMRWERRGDFRRQFGAIRARHGMPEAWEVKWKNLDGVTRKKVALDLFDWFFENHGLMFHCVVFRSSDVNLDLHNGSKDLARRKHFVMLVAKKMKLCAATHTDRPNIFRLWVDPLPSSYSKAGEAAEIIAGHTLRQAFDEEKAKIHSLHEHNSKETPSIQLCDLLLGAVMDAWQGAARKQEKRDVAARIAECLGWPDLQSDTWPTERKFNIWFFKDAAEPRTVETRAVNLKYQLPARRRG